MHAFPPLAQGATRLAYGVRRPATRPLKALRDCSWNAASPPGVGSR
jgi:hypothetical protein